MHDYQAYEKYPTQRKWFNKLWLSEQLNYNCGPSGIAPRTSGFYIVRPIMNLSGMSLGAEKKYIPAGSLLETQPGKFWCEWFDGVQYSVTFVWAESWKQISCLKADRDVTDLVKFKKWSRYEHKLFLLDNLFNEIGESGIHLINVEFIDDRPIEVHLRGSTDPDYNELIPIWSHDNQNKIDKLRRMGYSYIEDRDNADGFLICERLGFMVR